jgi:hypothetical protein
MIPLQLSWGVGRRETTPMAINDCFAICPGFSVSDASQSGRGSPAHYLGDGPSSPSTRAGPVEIAIKSFGIALHGAPAHAREHPTSIAVRGRGVLASPLHRPPNECCC